MLTIELPFAPPKSNCPEPGQLAGNSVEAVRRAVALRFRQGGLPTPELDARIIIGHALGLDHAALTAQAKHRLSADEAAKVAGLFHRRLRHEPIARIIGTKEFWGQPFKVNAHTFVPRPETETLLEAALEALGERRHCGRGLRIADLGTGTGALLLSLVSELPGAVGVGTDISVEAIDCARDNATAQGVAAAFVACHYGAALRAPIDLLVANPPYIPRDEIPSLEPEVRGFDPRVALDGGVDGLDGYRAIAADARRLLAPDGILVVELGMGQAVAVQSLFSGAGLAPALARPDLSGTLRALVAQLA